MNLIISKMEDKDFLTLYSWYKDPAYAVFFRHMPDNLSEDMVKAILTVVGMVIRIDLPDRKMAAIVSVSANDKTKIADLGVIVAKDLQSNGMGTMITKEMVQYLFDEGTVQRIVMYITEPDIIASLKRHGMFEECRMYKNAFYNGKLHSESRMVITRDFYKKLSKGV